YGYPASSVSNETAIPPYVSPSRIPTMARLSLFLCSLWMRTRLRRRIIRRGDGFTLRSPDVAHGESIRERIFGVDHILCEPRDPRLPGERGYDRGIRPDPRLFDQPSGKHRAEDSFVNEVAT